jgi:SAM-dependent methyltransferase
VPIIAQRIGLVFFLSAILSEQSLASLAEIRQWFDSTLGKQVLQIEQAILDQLLSGLFGYHLLQLSTQAAPLHGESAIQNKLSLGLDVNDDVPMIARATELPFANDSIDVVLLHHLLDFLDSPLDTLREIARVSLPMGHVVIVGFNPLSSWGLWKLPASLRKRVPWNANFIRPGRLMDWLNVLNFKIDRAHYCIYKPPMASLRERRPDYSHGLSRKPNLPLGAVYVIVAQKQIGTFTPMRPVWQSHRGFGQLSVVRPARRDALRTPERD